MHVFSSFKTKGSVEGDSLQGFLMAENSKLI